EPLTYLEGRCLSHGTGVPYLPVLDLLRRAWDLDQADPPDKLAAGILRKLREVGGALEEQAIYFLRLFGVSPGTETLAVLSPEAVKRRTFDAIRQVILRRGGLVVLAVEDLHWMDKTSAEFFTSVVDSTPGTALLFVSTYRPGYRPPWIDRSYVSQLALAPLSLSDSRRVVRAILGEAPETATATIVARAEGNPFFLEELALAVAQGQGDSLGPVPRSIADVLSARMERLPGQVQRVLESAAVAGRDVPVRLLEKILENPTDLAEQLQQLVALEFLYQQPASPGLVYSFKHALIQEVAYGRLTQAERITHHAATGRALESLYTNRLDEVLERLAYHYSRTDESHRAVDYLNRFAEKATASYSLVEAVSALKEALVHAERLPSDQGREALLLRIPAQLAVPLVFLGRLTEVRDLMLRYMDRIDTLDDPLLAGPHYFLLAAAYDHLGEPKAALENAHRSIAAATRAGDEATAGKAHVLLSHTNFWAGQFRSGVENGWRAARGLAGKGEVFWAGMAHWIRAWHHILLGEFTAAGEAGEEARAIGESIGDRRLESYGICVGGWVALLRCEFELAIGSCERAAALAPDPLAEAVILGILGEGYAEAGESHQAQARLERVVDLFHQ
ncbi:MAG: ATP-binding protein, partial [Thermoanaerobaculia bacterium]